MVKSKAQFQGTLYLLKGSDDSSTCLTCHGKASATISGYYVFTNPAPALGTPPIQRTPGGDFAWLKKTMTAVIRGATVNYEGDRHGHNIIAADFGYSADKTLTTAPGGTYPATNLACSSCHDRHHTEARDCQKCHPAEAVKPHPAIESHAGCASAGCHVDKAVAALS